MKVTFLFNELTVHPSVRASKPFRLGSCSYFSSPLNELVFSVLLSVTVREEKYNVGKTTGKSPVFMENVNRIIFHERLEPSDLSLTALAV